MIVSVTRYGFARGAVAALLGGSVLCAAADRAAAQVGPTLLPIQTQQIQRAITKNLRQAVKPELFIRKGATGAVLGLSMSAEGSYLATVLEDGSARLWNLQRGIEERRIHHPGGTRQARITSDGSRLVTVGSDLAARVWDVATGEELAAAEGHKSAIVAMAMSRDGETLVTADEAGKMLVWDPASGFATHEFQAHRGMVHGIAVGDDSLTVVTGGADGVARIWDLASGTQVGEFRADAAVHSVAFALDGGHVVTGDADGRIALWDRDDRRAVIGFRGHDSAVTELHLNPRGDRVASASTDGTVRVWHTGKDELIEELSGHDGVVNDVRFDATGQWVFSAGADGTTKLWDLQDGDAVAQLISTEAGWAVIDDKGRFDGDEVAFEDVQWLAGTTALSLDNFSQQYYEPGLLVTRLQDGEGAYLNPDVESIPDGIVLPPTVAFPPQQPQMDGQGRIELTVVAEDQGGGVQSVRLYHNGKIMLPGAVVRDDETRGNDDLVQRTVVYRLAPVPGLNRFEALATGKGGIEGQHGVITVAFVPANRKPLLHVAVIGIDKYRNDELNLDYGVADATAILRTLQQVTGGTFVGVRSYQLTDEKATKAEIIKLLRWFRQVPPDDILLLYFAGHGEAVDGTWYFLPHELNNIDDPAEIAATGISSETLRDEIAHVTPRRVMMLIDACRSGGAVSSFRDFVDRKELRMMSKLVGMHLLAATRKDQRAFELKSLGHGVFTHVVLRGLGGGADAQPTDGQVWAKEVLAYAEEQIPGVARRHAEHTQVPVTYSRGMDFPLTVSGAQ